MKWPFQLSRGSKGHGLNRLVFVHVDLIDGFADATIHRRTHFQNAFPATTANYMLWPGERPHHVGRKPPSRYSYHEVCHRELKQSWHGSVTALQAAMGRQIIPMRGSSAIFWWDWARGANKKTMKQIQCALEDAMMLRRPRKRAKGSKNSRGPKKRHNSCIKLKLVALTKDEGGWWMWKMLHHRTTSLAGRLDRVNVVLPFSQMTY